MFIRQMSVGEEIFRWVVIDDVDTFPHISQQALRRPMETYSHITRFLFIGTSEEDLIPALRSRCIHIPMNPIDSMANKDKFLAYGNMPYQEKFTDEMWSWIVNIAGNNISDLVRLLKLVSDIHTTFQQEPTLKSVMTLCSAPFYYDFLPLLHAMAQRNTVQAIKQLLLIWKKGYAYEDILESLQTINTLFGSSALHDIILVHQFLIHSWISYCKGNTSIIALQNMIFKTLTEEKSISIPCPSHCHLLPKTLQKKIFDRKVRIHNLFFAHAKEPAKDFTLSQFGPWEGDVNGITREVKREITIGARCQ